MQKSRFSIYKISSIKMNAIRMNTIRIGMAVGVCFLLALAAFTFAPGIKFIRIG